MDNITLDYLTQKGVDTTGYDDGKLQRLNDFIKLRQTAQNPKQGIIGDMMSGLESGLGQTKASAGAMLGNYDLVSSGLGKSQDALSELDPELQQKLGTISDPDSFVKTLLNLGENPRAAGVLVAQSLPSSIIGGIAALTGGKAIGVAGKAGLRSAAEMGIFGANSAFNESGAQILQTLSDSGVDITNEEQLKKAFNDPEIYNALLLDGLKKGIPVGAFDALSFKLAGKTVGSQGLGVGSALKETAQQATLGMAGEASGQLVHSGEITSRGDIALEGALEGVTGVPQAIIQPTLRTALDGLFTSKKKDGDVTSTPVTDDEDTINVGKLIEEGNEPETTPVAPVIGEVPVKDKSLEKEAKQATKPAPTLTIPSEVLRGTHKQMRTRLMSLPIAELNKRAVVNAGLDSSTLVDEKGKKLKKAALAERILSHYGVTPNETMPNKVQVARDPASRLKAERVEKNMPTPTGATLDQLIELAKNSKEPSVRSMATEWVKSIQNRKAQGTLTIPEADSKKIDQATKVLTKPVKEEVAPTVVEEAPITEEQAKASLSTVKGGNKRFQDALAAMTGQPQNTPSSEPISEPLTPEAIALLGSVDKGGIPMSMSASLKRIAKANNVAFDKATTPQQVIDNLRGKVKLEAKSVDNVNPILADEALKASPDKPTTIKVSKALRASPTLIKGMSAFEAMTSYQKTGDTRYLIHVVQTLLNSSFLTDKDKAALTMQYPEMARFLAKEMGVSVDDEAIQSLKNSPNLQPYMISSLLDQELNGKIDLEDSPRMKTALNKIKTLIAKNYGVITPKVAPTMTPEKAAEVVKANTETVKEAESWKTLDAYRKLSSDLGVYLDKEPKVVLTPESFKSAHDVSTLGKISRSMDVFRSMPSMGRRYPFFQPIMDMYMQRDNFRHTILQTHLKSAEKLVKKYGEPRSTKALQVLDIMSRPNQKDDKIQEIKTTPAGNIRYTDLDGKLKEVDAVTSQAIQAYQGLFKQNLAIIAQTVKTDMHRYGLNPTSNNRLEVLDLINEYKATGKNMEADRLQNALNLLDTLDGMFERNEAYFPHTRSRGPYAMATYAYPEEDTTKKPELVGFYSIKANWNGSVDKADLETVKARIQADQTTHGSEFVTANGQNINTAQPFYKSTNTLKAILMKNATNTSLAYEAVSSLLSQKGIDPKTVNDMFDELALNNNIEKLFTNLRRKKGYYGYDNDDPLNTTVNHLITQASLVTSYRYRPRIDGAFSKIGVQLGQAGPTGKDLLSKLGRYQSYMTDPEEEWTWIRSLNYWYFLAGNPSTMALQLLSAHLFTVPWVAQFTGFGPDFLRANYKVFSNYPTIKKILWNSEGYINSNPAQLAKDMKMPLEDAKILINLKKEGMLDPGYAVEAVGDTTLRGNRSRFPVAMKVLNKVAVEPMQATENMGRMNTAILLLDLLKRGNNLEKIGTLLYKTDAGFKARVDNEYGGNITKEAVIRQAIDENHAVFGKRGRAPFMRGPVGATLFAFQTYPQQMLESMARLAFDRGFAGRKAFLAAMFVYPIMFGGLMAVPMFDTWDWLMRIFAKQAQNRNTNLSLELSRALNELGMEDNNLKRMILHGPVFQGGLGIDVSQRLGLQAWFQPFLNAFLDPTEGFGSSAQDKLIGGASTIEANMSQAKAQIIEGDDPLKSYGEAFLPTALKNIVKAKGIYEGNIESTKGVNVLTPQELGPSLVGKPITEFEKNTMAAKRLLGVNPDLLSQANELKYQDSVIQGEYTPEYTKYNKKISRYLQDTVIANKKGDIKAKQEAQLNMANAIKDLVEFNKTTRDPKDPAKLQKDMSRAVKMDFYKNMFPLMVKNKNRPATEVVNELSLPAMEGRAMNRVQLPQ